ncbi:hypothetical protein BO71DRAFT_394886 [Aspergillus ellipticus CBS 707.79]|uniref:RNase MRP protein 1 RNA binding domain-containing protein n=1 Tax=Aspergillus ellipticus CBS 707.79 TaxID=1448320 RepID=A0A319DMU2_9EURO|nr:hypothetical protein BO71DRAFT_394886 [Aspergillus ellipticus CBS 707.79]
MGMNTDRIITVHAMLHLLFHRNKNQHRGTKWWKWLSALKRITLKLMNDLNRLPSDSGAELFVDKYRQYLAIYILPKCYTAFSTVVADGQFSTLGIVLLATLASLEKAIGFGKQLKVPVPDGKSSASSAYGGKNPENEDVGEILSRSQVCPTPMIAPMMKHSNASKNSIRQECSLREPMGVADIHMEKPRRKKRRKDAIDDLFKGLV